MTAESSGLREQSRTIQYFTAYKFKDWEGLLIHGNAQRCPTGTMTLLDEVQKC